MNMHENNYTIILLINNLITNFKMFGEISLYCEIYFFKIIQILIKLKKKKKIDYSQMKIVFSNEKEKFF